MHGSSVTGDCSGALRGLADDYERRLVDTGTVRWRTLSDSVLGGGLRRWTQSG